MKEIRYGNFRETGAKYRPIMMGNTAFDKVVDACEGHYGFGGEDKNTFVVAVNDWHKAIDIVNEAIDSGYQEIYVLRKAKIKL